MRSTSILLRNIQCFNFKVMESFFHADTPITSLLQSPMIFADIHSISLLCLYADANFLNVESFVLLFVLWVLGLYSLHIVNFDLMCYSEISYAVTQFHRRNE